MFFPVAVVNSCICSPDSLQSNYQINFILSQKSPYPFGGPEMVSEWFQNGPLNARQAFCYIPLSLPFYCCKGVSGDDGGFTRD